MKRGDDEATVVVRGGRPPRRRWLPRLVALLGLAALGGGGWLVLRPTTLPVAPPQRTERKPIDTHIRIGEADDEAAVLAAGAPTPVVLRFSPVPEILVLSFPTLLGQGRMLNRIGAFVEKAGLPHGRLMAEPEFAAALQRVNDSEETFYYGHDYRAADIARFFQAAARDGVALRPEESSLRALMDQEGLLAPGATGALISIPPLSDTPAIDAAARATILHHELSHGVYFTSPAYAAYAAGFWRNVLTEDQRAGFRHFLGAQDYDTGNEDLMINETQAYLMHTPDPRYFRPELAGLTAAQAEQLRRQFWLGMPPGWLKDATTDRIEAGH